MFTTQVEIRWKQYRFMTIFKSKYPCIFHIDSTSQYVDKLRWNYIDSTSVCPVSRYMNIFSANRLINVDLKILSKLLAKILHNNLLPPVLQYTVYFHICDSKTSITHSAFLSFCSLPPSLHTQYSFLFVVSLPVWSFFFY